MDKTRLQQRAQQFEEQYQKLKDALQAIEAEGPPAAESGSNGSDESVKPIKSKPQRIVEMRYQLGELCIQQGEFVRAIEHFHSILVWINTYDHAAVLPPMVEPVSDAFAAVLGSLKLNVMTNLASLYFRRGDHKKAMSFLLDAKKMAREQTPGDAASGSNLAAIQQLEVVLTANYAVFLHAQGKIEDAMHTATSVLEMQQTGDIKMPASDPAIEAATVMALSTLSTCYRFKGQARKALEYAFQATQRADRTKGDLSVVARTHNNLALLYFEERDFSSALSHFLTAYRAVLDTAEVQLSATIKYHIGLTIAELDTTVELPVSGVTAQVRRRLSSSSLTSSTTDDNDHVAEVSTAKDCFTQCDVQLSALSQSDGMLQVLTQAGQGDTAYYRGGFHNAEAEFTIALNRLKAILVNEKAAKIKGGKQTSKEEIAKVQGYLESYLGCAQLVQGKFDLAEASHQRDLELALESEDIYAQLRALRNLALVYNSTQRYQEAITLWHETLEIATVLQSKRDLMMGYSGLGTAVKELSMTEHKSGGDPTHTGSKPSESRQIFLRQRALAIELGDKNQQIIAQRHLVSTYELNDPASAELEQRLEECDLLVRLSEQYENLQYRADAYCSLANALTAQITRLQERGQRFAEAIAVLTHKRNRIAQQFRETTTTLTRAAAMMLSADEDPRQELPDRHPRQRFARIDVLQRR